MERALDHGEYKFILQKAPDTSIMLQFKYFFGVFGYRQASLHNLLRKNLKSSLCRVCDSFLALTVVCFAGQYHSHTPCPMAALLWVFIVPLVEA